MKTQIDSEEIQQLSQLNHRRNTSATRNQNNSLTRAIALNNQANLELDSNSGLGHNQSDLIPLNGYMQD